MDAKFRTPTRREGGGRPPPSLADLHRSDLVVAAVLIMICAILFWDTTRWPPVPASLAQNAPPTVFPRMLIGLVFVMALALPFERAWKHRSGEELDIGGEGWPKIVMFLTAAWIILAVYFMPTFGILPIMVASALLLPLMWGEKRYGAVILFAIVLPVAVGLLFGVGLQVNLAFGWTGEIFRMLR